VAQTEFDVAVVGTGLVGMACALAAARAHLKVLLIGPAPRVEALNAEPWDRRVYALNPGTQRFLDDLRVWPQLDAARLAEVSAMRVFPQAAATRPLVFDCYEAAVPALAWIVEHRELSRVLSMALAFQPVERHTAEVTHIEVGADWVELGEGGYAPRARLVIGADGAMSRVRAAAGIVAHARDYEHTAVVANFAASRPHGGVAWQWFTEAGVVALLPLPGNAVSLVWSAPRAHAEDLLALDPQALAAEVEAVSREKLGVLQPLSGSSGFPLQNMRVDTQSAQRVALVGDAAHVVHPLAGQGLNLGFEDVAVLFNLLTQREPFRDCGDARLLRRYARARAEPVFAMHAVTDGLQRLFASRDPLLGALRVHGMNLVQGLPVLKQSLARHALGGFFQ